MQHDWMKQMEMLACGLVNVWIVAVPAVRVLHLAATREANTRLCCC